MPKGSERSFSLFAVVLSLILYVTESNGQSNPPQREQKPVFSSFDPEAPPETRIKLAPFLTFGGQLEIEYRLERNLNLGSPHDEDLSTIEPELSLAFSFDPSRYFQAFFDVKLSGESMLGNRDKKNNRIGLEFEQAYILFKDLLDKRLSFQIGRQRFDDDRQWLYDKELDAGRAFFQFSRFLIELSVSREGILGSDFLNDNRNDNSQADRINNYIAYVTYAIAGETNVSAYVLFRDDRSDNKDNPVFLGIHSDGDVTDSLKYWLEVAYVLGKDGKNKIRGLGFDLGSTYEFNLPLEPTVTLGYAFGTGDSNPDDGVDKSFRQTGLEGNESDFNGVVDFKYYGELFDPELSNLSIFTAGAGIKPTEESSIDLVYHYYLQHKPSDSLRNAGIDADPNGLSKRLGSEIDLIVGYVGIKNLELALKLGYFIPGKAFPSESENSFLTRLQIQLEF